MNNKQITIPEIYDFITMLEYVRKLTREIKPKAALIVPSEIDSLKALVHTASSNLLSPIVIGDEDLAKRKAGQSGLDISDYEFLNIKQPDMAIQTAFKMAAEKKIDLIITGRIQPTEFIRIFLHPDNLYFLKEKTLSHISVFKTEYYPKLLFVSDAYINIEPDLQTKIRIINNAVSLASKLKIENPRVALLAAVETVSSQMEATVDGALLSKMSDRKQLKGMLVDGPLSFDIAIDMEAALGKGITNSEVAGQADILVASDIATANGIIKAMSLFTDSSYGGIFCGGRVPIAFCCPYDSFENRINSILLGILAGIRQ